MYTTLYFKQDLWGFYYLLTIPSPPYWDKKVGKECNLKNIDSTCSLKSINTPLNGHWTVKKEMV